MQLVAASCNLKLHYQGQWTCKSVGRKQQCRLTSWLPCAIFCVWNASKNRAPWKLSAKKVVKLTLSSITPMRLIVNKHHEWHAKIALKRKLNRAWNSWNASNRKLQWSVRLQWVAVVLLICWAKARMGTNKGQTTLPKTPDLRCHCSFRRNSHTPAGEY